MFSIEDRVRPGPLRQRRRARICGRGGPLVLGLSGYAPLAFEEALGYPFNLEPSDFSYDFPLWSWTGQNEWISRISIRF